MQDCVTGNSKQILVVGVIHNAEALTDTFNADFLSFFRLHIFGKGFPKQSDQILPQKKHTHEVKCHNLVFIFSF